MIILNKYYSIRDSEYSTPGKCLYHTTCKKVSKINPADNGFCWLFRSELRNEYDSFGTQCYTCGKITPKEIFEKARFLVEPTL